MQRGHSQNKKTLLESKLHSFFLWSSANLSQKTLVLCLICFAHCIPVLKRRFGEKGVDSVLSVPWPTHFFRLFIPTLGVILTNKHFKSLNQNEDNGSQPCRTPRILVDVLTAHPEKLRQSWELYSGTPEILIGLFRSRAQIVQNSTNVSVSTMQILHNSKNVHILKESDRKKHVRMKREQLYVDQTWNTTYTVFSVASRLN